MEAWLIGLIAVVATAILLWLKLGGISGNARKVAKILDESSDVAKAGAIFMEKFADYWSDHKLSPEEIEDLVAEGKKIGKEGKEVWDAIIELKKKE